MTVHRGGFWKRWMVMLVIPVVFLGLSAATARAQNCVVNALTDTGTGSGGSGDLRYCITQANAASTSFIITFASFSGKQTISLESPLPSITGNTTIIGPGPALMTIYGFNVGVMALTISSGATVTISGLTLANALNDGFIQNNGTFTVSNCNFSGNLIGISGSGRFTVTNCNFSGNQTGFDTAGISTVSNSTFSNNSGSGIFMTGGTLTVSNSTFSGNTATVGGAISGDGTLTVSNSTISGNTAADGGGGIAFGSGGSSLTVSNSTISGNTAATGGGGGILISGGVVTVSNSIVGGNTTTDNAGDDCDGCGTQSTYNLISTTSSPITAAQLLLAPLGSYGGPTQTMIPQLGSPALGAGMVTSADDPSTDQRGYYRPSAAGDTITLGAVEVENLIVTTAADQVDESPDCVSGTSDTCSLRDALTLANSQETADVAFAPNLTGSTITVSPSLGALPAITGNLNLLGPGANNLTVSGLGFLGSIFVVNSGAEAAFSGITIANGVSSPGAGVYNKGTLTLSNCTIANNTALFGAGILNDETLTVSNCTFSGNSATSNGGGIDNGGMLTVSNSTFSGNSNNSTTGGGGGINNGGTLTVSSSTFSGNNAQIGAAINNSGTLTVNNSLISANTSTTAQDGGIYNSGSITPTSSYNILTGNTGGDCDGAGTGCPTNGTNNNLVGGNVNVNFAPLGWYGGPTQTMLPLPGSVAICAGSSSLIPAGVTTDQRGFERIHHSYGAIYNPCVDVGSVQTNYQSVQFQNTSYGGIVSQAVSPAPVVTVTENSQSIGGVPVTLTFSGPSGDASGHWQETTAASTGADFNDLIVTAVGNYSLSATLNIVGGFSITTNPDATLDITTPQPTTTAINAPTIMYGNAGQVTVNVTSQAGTVTGNVSLSVDGGTALVQALSSGQSVFTLNGITAGNHSLNANYAAQGIFTASSDTGALLVNKATPTISLAPSANPSPVFSPLTFTATVSSSVSTPTGSVIFYDGTTAKGSGGVAAGVATYTTSSLAVGSHSITAAYTGDANFLGLTSSVITEQINPTAPTISWSPPAPLTYGGALSGILDASATFGASTVPGSFAYTATPSGGSASAVTGATVLGPGSYTLTVTFTPTDTTDYTVVGATVPLVVYKANPTVAVTFSLNPVLTTNPVTFTATVTSKAGVAPSGTVSFFDATTFLSSATLTSSTTPGQSLASYTPSTTCPVPATPPIPATCTLGTHPITAVYSGDTNFANVTSPVATLTVEDFTLSVNPIPGVVTPNVLPGGSLTFVLPVDPTSGLNFPSAVTFALSGLPAGATATFTPPSLPAGSAGTNVNLVIQIPNQILARHPANPLGRGLALAMVGGIFLLPFGRKLRRPAGKAGRFLCLLLLLLAAAGATLGLTSCGSTSSGYFGQQSRSYTVTITATSGALSHTTAVNFTVE